MSEEAATYLIRVGHHGNEHVEKDDQVANTVRAKHEKGPETGKFLDASQLKVGE